MKYSKKTLLSSAIGGLVFAGHLLSNAYAAPTADLTLADNQPSAVISLAGNTNGIFIIRLSEPPVATYSGGNGEFAATSAKALGMERLDTQSEAAIKYEAYLQSQQAKVLADAEALFGRSLQTTYKYTMAANGFAVALSADEAKLLGNMDGVESVQRERLEYITTDVGPAFIGAPDIWNKRFRSTRGEGMVIAVLDSGINSDHPSFSAVGGDGYQHTNPLGSGTYLPGSYCDTVDPTFCNDKLIGAWDMTDIDGTVPEDDDGHGSHTASTAAGNVVYDAKLNAPTTDVSFNISGVAPHANIIAYDVCQATCPGAALLAAINQVVIDSGNLPNGIAALNYSISGGGDPYNDDVELGFLAAVEAGIYVSASAGNSGPTESTVAHLGPWVSTTAASTHNRKISNSLQNLSSSGASLANLEGSSLSAGYGPAPIIHANTTEFDPEGQCLEPFPEGTFSGEIVMCDRGSIARTAKGQNVLAGGAGGYVLGNLGQGEGTTADPHFLPAIHIGDTQAAALRSWLTDNENTVATITESGFNLDKENGDIMAGFSSRGPQLAFDVLKPDVTAPGVDIMGAEANDPAATSPEYQIISGTSMSSPHNAGAGALLTSTRPNWTPTEIKSALMLTANTKDTFKEDGTTPTDPFDLGAGSIRLLQAHNSGLVMSESVDNFLAANPETGGNPSELNLASMMNSNCVGTCSWTRTVTNKGRFFGIWWVSADAEGFELDVDVDQPFGRRFSKHRKWNKKRSKQILLLRRGQSATITVTAKNYTSEVGWQFGKLNIATTPYTSNSRFKKYRPDLSLPVAVNASKASNGELFTKTVSSDTASDGDILSYQLNVTNGPLGEAVTVTDVLPKGLKFVKDSATETITDGTTTSAWAYDKKSKSLSWTGELRPGAIDLAANGNIFGYFSLASIGVEASELPGNCDDGATIVDVPAFTYNGASYTQVIWSVNGTLEAGTESSLATSFANQNLPDATPPNNIIAPFWRDLNACDTGNLYTATLSAGPYSWNVFEWENVPHFGSEDAATFQVWLRVNGSPTDVPQAHFAYGRLDNVDDGATVGAENADGSAGASYFFNGSGTPPQVGVDVWITSVAGGAATLSFDAKADCDDGDVIVNKGLLNSGDTNESAIAVTACQD